MSGDATIAAYFARIGYRGPRTPSLTTLRAIVARHTAAIPFENIDVLRRRRIRLDASALREKLVGRRRGGYCFEHNLLLMDVLRGLGFRVAGHAARVRWGRPQDFVAPRTHMLLGVDLAEGAFLADVGFGGLTPTGPLALGERGPQATPHENFRIVPANGEFDLEAEIDGLWQSLYRFSPQPQMQVDYEVANWFTSTHPEALFVRHLVMTRPVEEGRCTLFDDRLTFRRRDGRSERRRLAGADEIGAVLAEHFAIDLDEPGDLAALAEFLAARAAENGPDPFDGGAVR
jgi:N-hydroxyarylamine O-acetyltransferase